MVENQSANSVTPIGQPIVIKSKEFSLKSNALVAELEWMSALFSQFRRIIQVVIPNKTNWKAQ